MSGICGLYNLDGAPVQATELVHMTSLLERRGPEGTNIWHSGPVGLGHTLLATTPEAVFEHLPLLHGPSGCVITADARLDNRPELLHALDLSDRTATIGDAEIILFAYLRWGEACVERFLGDFAFAIWNPRQQTLFCARDHFGTQPLYIHHTPGRFFVFASEPRAILVLPQVPYRINEARIADFLISKLEGIDKTSTFFEEVYRLEPAHCLTVTPRGVQQRRYWTLEPGPELRLPSDEAYAEAFLEVFTEAVRCRLRSAGPVGSMLSGGMDSGSVVAIAREILAAEGRGPLYTFSAVAPDGVDCVETRAIRAALTMDGLEPTTISPETWDEFFPEIEHLIWSIDEPFENGVMDRILYVAAHRRGIKVLLDGIDGDNVLDEGHYVARLLRNGRWLAAYREAAGQHAFYGEIYHSWRELYRSARLAFIPSTARKFRHRLRGEHQLRRLLLKDVDASIIRPEFAVRIELRDRLRALNSHFSPGLHADAQRESIESLNHPYLIAAIEGFGRVGTALAVETRHPFQDLRVVALCLTLPGNQRLRDGWPKSILRRSMAGRLPDEVRWRRGKEHLGQTFSAPFIEKNRDSLRVAIEANWDNISVYVNSAIVRRISDAYYNNHEIIYAGNVYEAAHLAVWLRRNIKRPQPLRSLTGALP